MRVLNELSGREWIPAEVAGTEEGFWLDVPRRIYVTGRWGTLTVGARTQGWLPFLGAMPTRWPTWLTWWPVAYHPRLRRRGRDSVRAGWFYRKHPEWFLGGGRG